VQQAHSHLAVLCYELVPNGELGLVEAAVDVPVEGAPDADVSGVVRGGQ